jgi:tRNA threonylcarbamoyl adenosine modification protein YeaZ
MATLALLTCGPDLEVALSVPGRPAPSVVRLAGGSPRSRLLLGALDLLLTDASLEPHALECVAVSRGPGSFTGIRSGLATAAGLHSALDIPAVAWDSLTVQAARCRTAQTVWAAQPGRRGEVYAQPFLVTPTRPPRSQGAIEIVAIHQARERSPWIAPDSLDLAAAERVPAVCSAAEALLELVAMGAPAQPLEPLYVEAPPIHRRATDG